MAAAPHGQSKNERDQKNTNRIIPVEKFKPVILHAFEGVGPGSPTDCGGNHHDQGNAERIRCEHAVSVGKRVTLHCFAVAYKRHHSAVLACVSRILLIGAEMSSDDAVAFVKHVLLPNFSGPNCSRMRHAGAAGSTVDTL